MTREMDLTHKIEDTIERLQKLLPYVARDAKRYRHATDFVEKSRELHLAARAIDEVIPYPGFGHHGPAIRVRIGAHAVEGYSMHKLQYDFIEANFEVVEPGEEYDLRARYHARTDVIGSVHTQPIYGQRRYFDLATLGRTLEDGGELSVSQPGSSSNK